MKRHLKNFLILIISIISIMACDTSNSGDSDNIGDHGYIEFSNESDDVIIWYGIKLGNVICDEIMGPAGYTEFDQELWYGAKIETGSYYVEIMKNDGLWYNATDLIFTIQKGHVYDLWIIGSMDGNIKFQLHDSGSVDSDEEKDAYEELSCSIPATDFNP